MPVCSACAADKPRTSYTKAQLGKKDARRCKDCVAAGSSDSAAKVKFTGQIQNSQVDLAV